ncbi:MAG: hypothetical protein ACM3NF_10540 [Gemmatimonadota bacterium]
MKLCPILLAAGAAVAIIALRGAARLDAQGTPAAAAAAGVVADAGGAGPAGARDAGLVREITAYNVGAREQTNDSPCIGASGKDLCRLVAEGRKVCAANFVALGTVLRIKGLGEYTVLDRMHRRYPRRVDIAMRENAVGKAREFGVQRRPVKVMN